MATGKRYWLFKTEPDTYSIEDLAAEPRRTTCWEGIRNYQARNLIRDEMQVGDGVLVYHSSCKIPAVVGTATIVRGAAPDPTARDPQHHYYDPKASDEDPRWFLVDIRLETTFAEPVPLARLKTEAKLKGMELLRRGSRLSVQPVSKAEFEHVLKLAAVSR